MIGVEDYVGEKNTSCKEKETIILKSSTSFKLIMKYGMIINDMHVFSQMCESLMFSMPQFPYLLNANSNSYLIEF